MQITNYNNSSPKFCGVIKNTDLFRNCALEYAKGIKVGDDDWTKLKMFINTVKAIKNDGTSNEFIINKIGSPQKQLWNIKYGSYIKQDEYFKSDIFNGKEYGYEVLRKEAFKKIIEFGKEHFGLKELSKPIDEFLPAKIYLKRANNFANKSKAEKSRDISTRLEIKAQREVNRAEAAISEIREKLLSSI